MPGVEFGQREHLLVAAALPYLALFGAAQFGLGLLLLTLGTRLISATRSALIGSLETPLAPLWVWLAFGEVPPLMTCIGGAIVMAAVAADIVLNKAPGNGTNRARPTFVTRYPFRVVAFVARIPPTFRRIIGGCWRQGRHGKGGRDEKRLVRPA